VESIDYNILYDLQDKVLKVVFDTEREFYLTGGTCLSRFYHEKRYSDDLDFFTNKSTRFYFAFKNIVAELEKSHSITHEINAKEFNRIKVDKLLMVDFVNESVARYKEPVFLENNFIIDNIENILSNKLTAVMGRDNPKDIFDIFLICKFYNFYWSNILETAREKLIFEIDDLILRFKTFPKTLLSKIIVKDNNFLNSFDVHYATIIDEIKSKSEHKAFL